MKKMRITILSIFFLIFGMFTVQATNKYKNSLKVDGDLATYELYYRYKDLDAGYGGQHRLTVAMYGFKNFNNFYKYDDNLSFEENVERYMNGRSYVNEVLELFPRLTPHYAEIKYQIACHDIAKFVGKNEGIWDLEVQRKTPLLNFFIEFRKECNNAEWVDNRLLFYPGLKFNGIDIYPNMWVHYTNPTNNKLEYYYVDENYVGVTGWKYIDDWYYFNDFAVMQTGWLYYNNQWYYLHESGRMLTGLRQLGENYYILDRESGALKHSGWIADSGKWYYSPDAEGWLVHGRWYGVDGVWYYFNNDATMRTGWLGYEGDWYYLEDSGAMAIGWRNIGGFRYYFKSSGVMLTGVHVIGNVEYEFNSSGHLIRTGKKPELPPACNKYTCIMPYSASKGVSE